MEKIVRRPEQPGALREGARKAPDESRYPAIAYGAKVFATCVSIILTGALIEQGLKSCTSDKLVSPAPVKDIITVHSNTDNATKI